MIKLSDKLYVAEDEIAEVTLSTYHDSILVKMKSGDVHNKDLEYGRVSIYTQLANFVAEIDK
jgi:hypothetical protein